MLCCLSCFWVSQLACWYVYLLDWLFRFRLCLIAHDLMYYECGGVCVQVRVEIESLVAGVDLSEPLTRARFEELNADLFKKTLGPVRKVGLLWRQPVTGSWLASHAPHISSPP